MHASFAAFVETYVMARRSENPGDSRLDGQTTGGNFDVVGEFRHWGRRWKVHADTHYEPLLMAYEALKRCEEPFVEDTTKNGKCLNLRDDLHERLSTPLQFKYLYICES